MDYFQGLEPHEISALSDEIQELKNRSNEREKAEKQRIKKLATFLFYSFFHSQGEVSLQEYFFGWFCYKYRHQYHDHDFTRQAGNKILSEFRKMTEQYFLKYRDQSGSDKHNIGMIKPEGKKMLKIFLKCLSDNNIGFNPLEINLFFDNIIKKILTFDEASIARGRKLKSVPRVTSFTDPLSSQFCDYVLLQSHVTALEFRELFMELRARFLKARNEERYDYHGVVQRYCQDHDKAREKIEAILNS